MGIVILAVVVLAAAWPWSDEAVFGVTFSQPHTVGIGLDWQETYQAILKDLGVRRLRLSAYWNAVEPEDDEYDFKDLDWQMDEAAKYEAKVVLSIGRKLPRWPECHAPGWSASLTEAAQQEKVLEMLEEVVARYKDHPALYMWQLENEPVLDFGECPPQDLEFLRREEKLVRQLDIDHPILITDSGELNSWLVAAGFGDVLGTTMYRTVWSSRTNKPFSYDYIFPSWLYRLKSRYIKVLRGKDTLISELQGEPWGAKSWLEMTKDERAKSITPERLAELGDFAIRTGLPEVYWWGVEYWYWEKEINGDDRYWEAARAYY